MRVEAKPVPTAGSTFRRTLTALIAIPVFLLPLWWGGRIWSLLLALIALLGAWEWMALVRTAGLAPSAAVVYGGTALILAAVMFWPDQITAAAVILVLAALAAQLWPVGRALAPANAGVTVLGPLYVALFAALDLLRRFPDGLGWTFLVVVSVWVADSAAYFGGRRFGRRALAPPISPKKTWEGAWSGEAGGILAALVVAAIAGLPLLPAALVGALPGTVGLVGDLSESALKRAAGVKDSGTLLPGHGGVLDRFDAMLFVAPVAYLLLVWWPR